MNDVRKCEVIIAHFGLKIDANLIGSIFLFFRPSLVKKEFKPTKLPRFDGPLREGGLVWPRRASFLPPSLSPSLSFSLSLFLPPFLPSFLPPSTMEAKRLAAQLQFMAGQLDRLANHVLSEMTK